MTIKPGSRWRGVEDFCFRVISVTEIQGKTWIYYRQENTDREPREFSCLEDSFLARFTPYINE
jgi:hypothetical protein